MAKVRSVYRFGFNGLQHDIGCHSNRVDSLVRGLVERVFLTKQGLPPPVPADQVFERLTYFRARVGRFCSKTAVWSHERVCASYQGRKRRVYERARESLITVALNSKDLLVKAFVKFEKTDMTSKDDPAPRIIQPFSARYNLLLATYIKPLEHRVFEAIRDLFGGEVTVLKGLNYHETAKIIVRKWGKFNVPVAVGLDAERWDQCVSVAGLQWEFETYLACFQNDPELRRLLWAQMELVGSCRCSDGFVRYRKRGSRASGVMNTGLGNCLIACGILHALMQHLGIRMEVCNNGDDCTVIMESSDLPRFMEAVRQWFLDFGFRLKVEEPVYRVEQIEFCQTHPVYDGIRWTMCRDPKTALTKDEVSCIPLKDKTTFFRFIRSIGEGGMALAGGLPILDAFYSNMLRSSEGYKAFDGEMADLLSNFTYGSKKLRRQHAPITEPARESFYFAFGILPDVQEELERSLVPYEWTGCTHAGSIAPHHWWLQGRMW